MKSWIGFSLLWMLTGSPVLAGLLVLGLWAVADWYTFGFARRIWRAVMRLRRGRRLEHLLLQNPHDRKARAELGEILVEQRRHRRAIEVLRPVLDADPGDLTALFFMGVACLATGKVEQGELFLKSVYESDEKFRGGAPLLELGRYRLARGDATGAVESLTGYLSHYSASVEAHYLLSRAWALAGDASKAHDYRERAWDEYRTSPSYQQRQERPWAWRARPARPIFYGALIAAGLVAIVLAMRSLPEPDPYQRYGHPYDLERYVVEPELVGDE